MTVIIKRVYDPPSPGDGYRVLVDRLWPRGMSRASLELDEWMKDIAPSNELRRRFHHDVDQWEEFQEMYFKELEKNSELADILIQKARAGTLTLLYAARDEEHNNAIALKNYLERKYR